MTASVADRAVDEGGVTRRALPPLVLFAIVGAVVAVDQLTKVWAVAALSDGPFDVGGPLSFRLHRNSGSAFSLFAGATPVLAVLAVVLTVVLVRLGSRATDRATAVGLALVLGGALGNLIDRLVRDPGFLEGAVVDFIRLEHWPTFNGADSAITIGVALVVLRGVLGTPGATATPDGGTDRADDDPAAASLGAVDPGDDAAAVSDPADGRGAFVVPAALDRERVDRVVALVTGCSRAEAQELVAAGLVQVEGRPVAKSRRLSEGEQVEVTGEPERRGLPQPEDIPIDVRYEDDDVLVIAKPAGLVVHPGAGHHDGTLVNALLHRNPSIADVGDPERPGIVHRLDVDTSGLLVVALSQPAYEVLVAVLAAREVERRYLALAMGTFATPRGVIDAPIGRSTQRRTRMAVAEGGREARTEFTVLEAFADRTLVECKLQTGRTHQIRVHLAAVDHPVAGDRTYGGGRAAAARSRPFLHAHRLAFDHPVTGVRVALDDPLPPELQSVLDDLRAQAAVQPGDPSPST